MTDKVKAKKPIWKRWWAWAIVIILVIAVASGGGDDEEKDVDGVDNNGSEIEDVAEGDVDEPDTEEEETQDAEETEEDSEPVESENSIKAGMYKIGEDLPEGEYVIVTTRSTYFEITTDSTGSFDSILANDNFENRAVVTVNDGEYLNFNRGDAYSFDDAPKPQLQDGALPEGMYKVGVDFPPGEYKIVSDGSGYVEVCSDSTHDFGSIISNDNFEGERYITVSDGQYLKLARAYIIIE